MPVPVPHEGAPCFLGSFAIRADQTVRKAERFYQCPALDWIAGYLFDLREGDVILFAGSHGAPILATSSETEINQYVVVAASAG